MGLASMAGSPTASLDSLFLPLLPEQNAIFCALTSLFDWAPYRRTRDIVNGPQTERKGNAESVYSAVKAPPCRTTTEGPSRSQRSESLFELLSARVEVAVVVLRTSDVVFFDLRSKRRSPSFLQCINSNGNSWSSHNSALPSSYSFSTAALGMASCAALISLEVSYACRIPCGKGRRESEGGKGEGGGGPLLLKYREYSYPRGIVGGEDGRVSVFSENAYLLSFIAHDCPVVSVHAIYASPEKEGGGEGGLENLGFVTLGADGVVYAWWYCKGEGNRSEKRRRRLLSEGTTNTTTTMLSRQVAFALCQPRFIDWLFLPSYAMLHTPDVDIPQLFFIYASSSNNRDNNANNNNNNNNNNSLQARFLSITEASESASPLRFYALPSSSQQQIAAIAVDGELCVAARGVELFLITPFSPGKGELGGVHKTTERMPVGRCIFSSPTAIKNLYLHNNLLAVSCKDGLLFALELPSGSLIASFCSYNSRPVKSITLNARARLMVVVDAVGDAVEIIRLPKPSFKRSCELLGEGILAFDAVNQLYAGSTPAARVLQTALALRYRCQAEELSRSKSSSGRKATPPRQATMNLTTIESLDDKNQESTAPNEGSESFSRKIVKKLKETYHILRFSIPGNYQKDLSRGRHIL